MKTLARWSSALTALLGLGLGLGGGLAKAQNKDDPDIKSVPLRTHSLYQVGWPGLVLGVLGVGGVERGRGGGLFGERLVGSGED